MARNSKELAAMVEAANQLAREAQQNAANAREQYRTAATLYRQISDKLEMPAGFLGMAEHNVDEQITTITAAINAANEYKAAIN